MDITQTVYVCSIRCSVTHVLPGPQAVGQVLGVQNSDRALENRLMCLKNATAERNQCNHFNILDVLLLLFCEYEEQFNKGIDRNLVTLTVAGEPLCLVDARRQRCESKHICVCDPLAHVLLLQIRPHFLIIVINSPWEDSAELMKQRQTERQKISLCKTTDRSVDLITAAAVSR